jgi:hypothetical protein
VKKRLFILLFTILFVLTVSPLVYSSTESIHAATAKTYDIPFERPENAEEAKALIAMLEGDAIAEALPEEYILQAMTYQDAKQSVEYWKMAENGNAETLCEDDFFAEIEKQSAPKISSLLANMFGFSAKEYGYMKIITTAIRVDAPETCIDERNEYFIVSARAEWLYRPTWAEKGTLNLSYNAIFDANYKNIALLSEMTSCKFCEEMNRDVYAVSDSKNGRTDVFENANNHLSLTYRNGFSCDATYATTIPCSHKLTECTTLYTRLRIYSQEYDFTVSATYQPNNSPLRFHFMNGLGVTFVPSKDTTYHGAPLIVSYLPKA